MIDPDLIQQYYSQLSNEDLVNFTKNEGNRLSDEAINYLFDEYVRRGLDISILEQIVDRREESKEAAQTDNTGWNYALNAKKLGKTDTEILQDLTAKEIGEQEAASIISRLPNMAYENEHFEDLIESTTQGATLAGILGILMLFGLGAFFLYLGVVYRSFIPIMAGLAVVILGIVLLTSQDKEYKGKDYWVKLLKEHPEKIVWIKPIITKHTIGYVFTLYRDHKFQLLTTSGEAIILNIDTDIERLVFFNGIRQYLPHAHIGYTPEVDALFSADPDNFITILQERQIYRPMDTFDLEIKENNAHVLRHRH
ncbi:MAG TPA: hypothetical protein VIM79_10810 [Niastella sp.]